jgi:multiple antibiotic resistance protein
MKELFLPAAKIFILLFAIVDPFGNVPLFLGMTLDNDDRSRGRMAFRASLTAFVVLALFALFGRGLLSFFSVDVPAFKVAGGVVLALMALPMLAATRIGARLSASEEEEGADKADVSIVPHDIPL